LIIINKYVMLNFKDWLVIKEAAPVAGQATPPAAAVPMAQKPSVPANSPAATQETDAQRRTRLAQQAKETAAAAESLRKAADAMKKLGVVTQAGAT
jgi:hypothetical protein